MTEAIKHPGIFDAQLYLFETVGTLVSLFYKSPDQRNELLSSIVNPMLDELSRDLQAVKGTEDVMPILKVHHNIMALGNIAKGFPDFPSPIPEGYLLPPVEIFTRIAQAILVSLEALNVLRPIRDAVRIFDRFCQRKSNPSFSRREMLSLVFSLLQDRISHI